MPSSRPRARKASSSSGGRKSPDPTATFSDLLSSTPVKRDDLMQCPSKRRRVDMTNSSADEDESGTSPLINKRSWETFESNYKFLMEEDIIRTCRTGDQFGDEAGGSSTVSLAEFMKQYSELAEWLAKVDARRHRPAATHGRVEKYLDQGFAEELLQRTPRKKLLRDYAQELQERHPEIEAEIGERLAHLDTQWEAAEKQTANIDEDRRPQVLKDIHDDVDDLEAWHSNHLKDLPNSNEWMQMIALLSRRDVKERQKALEIRQADIENRSRSITHVLKLISKLLEPGSVSPSPSPAVTPEQLTILTTQQSVAQRLEDSYHAAWLQSLELLYCTEQFLASPPVEQQCSLSSVVIGSWCNGASPEKTDSHAFSHPKNESVSFDVLPFSEDEYEKIAGEKEASMPTTQHALYAADLCYEEADTTGGLSRGATLHRRSQREAVVRRQSASARLPGPGPSDSLFLSESELFTTEWTTEDRSELFGPVSRSAEVLLSEPGSLEVSQHHAVLSVTPQKAYYRMTALDHELTNDWTCRTVPPPTNDNSVAASESPAPSFDAGETRAPLLDMTLAQLAPIGEETGPEASSSAMQPIPGQKRRYSRSACAWRREDQCDGSPSWLPPQHDSDGDEEEQYEEEEEEEDAVGADLTPSLMRRTGMPLERSASESSVIDGANRSSSWRELANQLERTVRRGSSSGLLMSNAGHMRHDDDAGSLADESASSGGDASAIRPDPREFVPMPPAMPGSHAPVLAFSSLGRSHGGRVRRLRRKTTSMQLAEQAELIVQPRPRGPDSDQESPESERDELDAPPRECPLPEDSLDQAWDNYQAPMYPSTCEDDDEAEERLDLCWDEQLEASVDTSNLAGRPQDRFRRPEGETIEELIARSSMLLERARFSHAVPPSTDHLDHPLSAVVTPCDSRSVGTSFVEGDSDLQREVERQGEWLAACEHNLTCLDHLKESLTDSGVEDDLEPIRAQVAHLLRQWRAFKEETLNRLELIEGLHRIHVEADAMKAEVQRLADLLDAPTEQRFMDGAQLDKFISTLEFYASHLPEWQIQVDSMHQSVCELLEQDRVDYLDVRKCYAENLHLFGQWLFSLHTRSMSSLNRACELREAYDNLNVQLHNCDSALSGEEYIVRCTRLAIDIMNYEERDTALRDLKALEERLVDIQAQLDACEEHSGLLAPAFVADHWQHIDSRLTGLNSRMVLLRENCVAVKDSLADRRPNIRPPGSPIAAATPKKLRSGSTSPKIRRRAARKSVSEAGGEVERRAVNSWRGRRLWRILRSSLPYQMALLVLFGCVYYLLADGSPCANAGGRLNNFLFSPQVRQAYGSPY